MPPNLNSGSDAREHEEHSVFIFVFLPSHSISVKVNLILQLHPNQIMTSTSHTCVHMHTHRLIVRDSLGVGLLQQGAPELLLFWGAEVDQVVALSWQQVVYLHLLPLTVLPELQRDRGWCFCHSASGLLSTLQKAKSYSYILIFNM